MGDGDATAGLEGGEVGRIFREESGRSLAALIRVFGDIDLAEDAVQEAFAVALDRWPRDGVPPNPGGWITTTARNHAIDRLRRESRGRELLSEAAILAPGSDNSGKPQEVGPVEDDRLRLIFTCCHPALSTQAQMALTLRLRPGGMRLGVPDSPLGERWGWSLRSLWPDMPARRQEIQGEQAGGQGRPATPPARHPARAGGCALVVNGPWAMGDGPAGWGRPSAGARQQAVARGKTPRGRTTSNPRVVSFLEPPTHSMAWPTSPGAMTCSWRMSCSLDAPAVRRCHRVVLALRSKPGEG